MRRRRRKDSIRSYLAGLLICLLILFGLMVLIFGPQRANNKKTSGSGDDKPTTTIPVDVDVIGDDKENNPDKKDEESDSSDTNNSSSNSNNSSSSSNKRPSSNVSSNTNTSTDVEDDKKDEEGNKEDNNKDDNNDDERLPEEKPPVVEDPKPSSKFTINNEVYKDGDAIYARDFVLVPTGKETLYVSVTEQGFEITEVVLVNGASFSLTSYANANHDGNYTIVIRDDENEKTTINVTIDTKVPVIERVEDDEYYNVLNNGLYSDTSITISDINLESVKLNGKEVAFTGSEATIELTESGVYTIEAEDAAHNITAVRFTIDADAPDIIADVFNILPGGYVVTIYDEHLDTIVVNGGLPIKVNGTRYDLTLEESGDYEIVATDAVGNARIYFLIVDADAPVISGVKDGDVITNETVISVDDEHLVSVYVDDEEVPLDDHNYVDFNITISGEHIIRAIDAAGNETVIKVTVNVVTSVIEGVEDGGFYKEADITISDADLESIKINGVDEPFEGTSKNITISESGVYTITVTSKTKGPVTITFTVDADAPDIVIEEDSLTHIITVIVSDDNLASITINGEEKSISGTTERFEFAIDGTYIIVATDKAGNESVANITVHRVNQYEALVTINGAIFDSGYRITSDKFVIESIYDGTIDIDVRTEGNNFIYSGNGLPNGGKLTIPVPRMEDGEYIVTITADNGNQSIYYLTIDTTSEEEYDTRFTINGQYVKDGETITAEYCVIRSFVDDTLYVKVKQGDDQLRGTILSKGYDDSLTDYDGEYTIVVDDQKGHTTTITVIIEGSILSQSTLNKNELIESQQPENKTTNEVSDDTQISEEKIGISGTSEESNELVQNTSNKSIDDNEQLNSEVDLE